MEELPAKTTYGKALRAERKRLELTQAELAEKAGTSQQNIQQIEAGRSVPKPKIHEKLVELFGGHSPLVNASSRGEIVLAANAIATAKASAALSNEAPQFSRKDEMPELPVSNTDMNRWWAEGAAKSAKEMEEAIGDCLPQNLRINLHQRIDSGKRALRPGYKSEKIVAEWKFVTNNRMDVSARVGMQQLCVFRAAMVTPNQRFALMLVTSQLEAMRGKAMLAVSEEADLLGIEVFFCNDGEAVAKTIAHIEFSTEEESEDF